MGKWINLDDLPSGRVEWEDIFDAPSIDIVRCKECKWRGIPTACPIDNFYAQRWTKDDDFCSYGERMDGSGILLKAQWQDTQAVQRRV